MEKTINKTKKFNLCISCEICGSICPKEAINYIYQKGQFLPFINTKKCNLCGLCLELCPGIDLNPLNFKSEFRKNKYLNTNYIESYTAFTKNSTIREKSTSGGIITSLVKALLEKKLYDYAFTLKFENFNNESVKVRKYNKVNDILESSKSKYLPASLSNIVRFLLTKKDNEKCIIVGLPCQIYGIKKVIKYYQIPEENILFIGLFCDKTLNFNFLKYLSNLIGYKNEELIKFYYRTKESSGWSGDMKLYFNSNRIVKIDKSLRVKLKKFFQLERCLYCYDKLNFFSDLCVGDCYIVGEEDFQGKSNIIIRTKKGKKIFNDFKYLFHINKENIYDIAKSQNISKKKDNFSFQKILKSKMNQDYSFIVNKSNKHNFRNYLKLKKKIKFGQELKIKKIKIYLLAEKLGAYLSELREMIYNLLIVWKQLFKDLIFKKNIDNKKKINIIIIGGELFNKGSEGMTYITIENLKKIFPNKIFYLFSKGDFKRSERFKNNLNFEIVDWSEDIKYKIIDYPNNIKKSIKWNIKIYKILKIIRKAKFFIDISGYQLSSQWGFFTSFGYISNIIIASKFRIPYYIFPQSIGTFHYNILSKIILYPLFKKYLQYPKKIYCREYIGYKSLLHYTEKNLDISNDLLLLSKSINKKYIYKKDPDFKEINIKNNSVGIIPNLRVIERMNMDYIKFYKKIINLLIKNKKTVYLFAHSNEDIQIIQKLKKSFKNSLSVKAIYDNLNFFELKYIIQQFEFIITSRYHSIVQCYINYIPVIAIGWSYKYYELLKIFSQSYYHIDVRNNIDIDLIKKKIETILLNCKKESKIIEIFYKKLKKPNIFKKF